MAGSFAELYFDQVKFFRNEDGGWRLPRSVIITAEGRELIEGEPNVEEATLEALKQTDWSLLKEADTEMIMSSSQKELSDHAFFEHDEIGLLHLSQCIYDEQKQPLGELIARYSMERGIPFLLGAIYVKALMTQQQLFYFERTAGSGSRRIRWTPTEMYIPPDTEEPPIKKRRRSKRKELDTIPEPRVYPLYACPICGNPAKLYRCGKNSIQWHACCTDPTRECPNFTGLPPMKTEKRASTAWNDYVRETTETPVWSADVQAKKEKEEALLDG